MFGYRTLLFFLLTCNYVAFNDSQTISKTKIVVDVDTGTDDAMALLYLLRAEKNSKSKPDGLQIIGITCVEGNARLKDVIVNTHRVLKLVNRLDIPVYKGASGGLLETPKVDFHFGKDGLGDVAWNEPRISDYIQKEHAAIALTKIVNENPGEITILSLAPLTNIALAIKLDPDFMKKIKKIIIMGGSVQGIGNMRPGVEFNFYMDPEADHIVLNSSKFNRRSVIIVPWETVLETHITNDWRKNVLGKRKSIEMKFFNKVEPIHKYSDPDQWLFSDVLVSAIAVNETLIGRLRYFGMTVIREGPMRGGLAIDYSNLTGSKSKVGIVRNIHKNEYLQSILNYIG